MWAKYQDSITQRVTYRHSYSSRLLLSNNPERVLDVGCGSGALLSCLPSKVFSVGLEYNEKNALNSFRNGIRNIVVADALKIPFGGSIFDSVCILEVIEHIASEDSQKVLKEIELVLKNQGLVVISVPFDHWLSKLMDPAWIFGHRHYSITNIRQQIACTGLVIRETHVKGGWWEMASMLNLYISKWFFGKEMLGRVYFERKRQCEYERIEKGFATLFAITEKRGI